MVLVVDGASAEGATAPEGLAEGVLADVGIVEAVTADVGMVASSPADTPQEGLRGDMADTVAVTGGMVDTVAGMVDTAAGMAGLGLDLDLVSPIPHGPTGMAITRIRPTTLLTPTLTTDTRRRTTAVRLEAWVSSSEVLGEAALLPAAEPGAISAGADLGTGKRSALLGCDGSFRYEIVAGRRAVIVDESDFRLLAARGRGPFVKVRRAVRF